MTLTVAVVIPAYNHARFVAEAVASALGQTRPPEEVVVVDDGSTDDTASVLAAFGPRIRVISQANAGVSTARNRGVTATTAEVIAFLDADDAWLTGKLEAQLERLERSPEIGLVHCGAELIDADGRHLGFQTDGLEGEVAEELLLFRRPVVLGGGSGFVIRRSVLEAIGGFDPALSTSADWDLWYRAARLAPIGFVADPLLRYRLHGSNMHANVDTMERDMLQFMAKAFAEPGDHTRLAAAAYGRLHFVLAGSYARAGRLGPAIRHGLRAMVLQPSQLGDMAAGTGRRLRKVLRPHAGDDAKP